MTISNKSSDHNSLSAFAHIIANPDVTINPLYISSNRINSVGDALEMFIKDAYAGILGTKLAQDQKDVEYSKVFSWLGNSSSPPDMLLRGGDGIEVKKIESLTTDIALNSSFPKDKLHSSDTRVASGAKNAEQWQERDIAYAIGSVPGNELKRLWLIYGDCYAASNHTYERLIKVITGGVRAIADVEFHDTNELAKVKKVDPLAITDMRIRGMWHIKNPSKLYASFIDAKTTSKQYYLLMREEKYQSFDEALRAKMESIALPGYTNNIIDIADPDKPEVSIKARFIKYEI